MHIDNYIDLFPPCEHDSEAVELYQQSVLVERHQKVVGNRYKGHMIVCRKEGNEGKVLPFLGKSVYQREVSQTGDCYHRFKNWRNVVGMNRF